MADAVAEMVRRSAAHVASQSVGFCPCSVLSVNEAERGINPTFSFVTFIYLLPPLRSAAPLLSSPYAHIPAWLVHPGNKTPTKYSSAAIHVTGEVEVEEVEEVVAVVLAKVEEVVGVVLAKPAPVVVVAVAAPAIHATSRYSVTRAMPASLVRVKYKARERGREKKRGGGGRGERERGVRSAANGAFRDGARF